MRTIYRNDDPPDNDLPCVTSISSTRPLARRAHTCLMKLDQIRALADRVDGPLPSHTDPLTERAVYALSMSASERNLIADALTVLYGVEKRTAAS